MIFVFGDHELDEERLELRRGGEKVAVQPRVLDVLLHLVRARDHVVLKRDLLEAVWSDVTVNDAAVSRAILEARRAIGDELQQVLVTVRSRGFRFAAPVTTTERATAIVRAAVAPAIDGTFIGRAACMAALDSRLLEAMAGHGRVVWLSGEAGIGKSRTLDQLARSARARKALVLVAHAHEAPETPPYWLWTQLARALAADRGETASKRLEGALASLTSRDPAPSSEARFGLFDAVTRFFVSESRARPIVIALDDVHWADADSLALLLFFVRELTEGAVLVVGTFRDAALADGAHATAMGNLVRESASLLLPLRGLAREELPRFVEVVTGSEASPALVRALQERTGGNPLYLHQLLRTEWAEKALESAAHELASSIDLQQGIIESILRHVDNVSGEVRELLTVAAVLGREFDLVKLGVASGLNTQALLDRLDEAMRARLVVKTKDGAHRFGHTLVRDVLYKKLSSAERAARHHAVANALLAHVGESWDLHAAEIAHHFVLALPGGDPTRAVDLAIRAAEQDAALGEHRTAMKNWERATKALAHVRADDARRVRVLLGLARASAGAGEEAAAREAYLDAVMLARTFGRNEALAQAAVGFARLSDASDAQRRALLDEATDALASASGSEVPELRALVQASRDRAT